MNTQPDRLTGVADAGSGKAAGNAVGSAGDGSGDDDGHGGSDVTGTGSAPPRLPARAYKNDWDDGSSRD